jgi:hypothetical protein
MSCQNVRRACRSCKSGGCHACMHACVMSSWRFRALSACGTLCLCGVSRMFSGISCEKLMSFTFVPALVHQFNHHVDLIDSSAVEVLAHIRG